MGCIFRFLLRLFAEGISEKHCDLAALRTCLLRLYIRSRFPEEVAFRLSEIEYNLFYQVQPLEYVRFVSCDLVSAELSADMKVKNPSLVQNLLQRFAEVCLHKLRK